MFNFLNLGKVNIRKKAAFFPLQYKLFLNTVNLPWALVKKDLNFCRLIGMNSSCRPCSAAGHFTSILFSFWATRTYVSSRTLIIAMRS